MEGHLSHRAQCERKDPLLQGWAIVDNTTGQDWEKINLSLVAGAPQSFIQNLSQPYYSRRPVVPMPESALSTPQTFESTLVPGTARLAGIITDANGAAVPFVTVQAIANGARVGETKSDASGRYDFQSLPDGPVQVQFEAQGFQRMMINGVLISPGKTAQQNATLQVGSVSESVTVTAAVPSVQTETTELARGPRTAGSGRILGGGAGLGGTARMFAPPMGGGLGPGAARASAESAAVAQELGDLFEYNLKDTITIQKNRSALVPIVQSTIAGEKVSVWNDSTGLPRPQRALWLTNSSGLTLDGGSFSVLEDETFAGEGIFDPIRPGERRLVSYATDLALNASSKLANHPQRVTQVRVSRGLMIHLSEMRESKTYTFRNEDSSAREVIIEHPVRIGYTLRSALQPAETSAAWMRFRLQVAPKQTASLVIDEARPILTQKSVIAELEAKKEDRDGQMETIFDDQQRLREI